jgi:DNA ligase D-like protein (predicted ligase)
MLTIESTVSPMLAYPSKPFDSADFRFEVKYDGTRGIGYVRHGRLRLLNRRKNFFEHRFPELASVPSRLRARDAIVDGEVVVFDENGVADFSRLLTRDAQQDPTRIRLLARSMPATYVLYDVLLRDDRDLTRLPLADRRALLEELVEEGDGLALSPYITEHGSAFFEGVRKIEGMEGVMGKRTGSPYALGRRSKDWLKIKSRSTLDCFVVAVTQGAGSVPFGALVVAGYLGGKPTLLGKVGTGFDARARDRLEELTRAATLATPPLALPGPLRREVKRYTRPIVIEVEAQAPAPGHYLRAPSFRRLRPDKSPKECVLDGLPSVKSPARAH